MFQCTANQNSINPDIVNVKIDRTIDLTSHLPKISISMTVENGGKTSARSLLFAVEKELSTNLAFIGAIVSTDNLALNYLLNNLFVLFKTLHSSTVTLQIFPLTLG